MANTIIKKFVQLIIVTATIIFFLTIVGDAGTTDNSSNYSQSELAQNSSLQNISKLHGINFSPYIDGQNPEYGSQVNKEQVIDRLKIIAPYTTWIRTYGTENGLEYIGPAAYEIGLKTAIGAWLGKDAAANDRQINELINESKAGYVDLAIVGSETLLRNDLPEDQLIEYVKRVKNEVPGINVTTADTYDKLLEHPKVMAECDVIMYNSYPYWEGISIDNAIERQDKVHRSILNEVKNKPVFVSETGWPSAGNAIGDAVPSPENSTKYLNDFTSWARKNNVQYFYFEAFDETWKATNEGPQGAYWGIWDKDGNLKLGMETILLDLGNNTSINNTEGTAELESVPVGSITYTQIGVQNGTVNKNNNVNESLENEQKKEENKNMPGFEINFALICGFYLLFVKMKKK